MKSNKYLGPFVAVTVLFLLWGFITVLVDSLVPRLRDLFGLGYGAAGMFQFAFFIAYFVVSIPAGWILSKLGYRKGIIVGLAMIALGCFLYGPAAGTRAFILFTIAFFTVASGMAFLQVAANPYVSVLGPPEGASSRLNLAQAFNSLGTFLAPPLGAYLFLSDHVLNADQISALPEAEQAAYYAAEASAVQGPFYYIGIAVVIIMIAFLFIPLPQLVQSGVKHGFLDVLKVPRLRDGALGILVYVGTEVAIGTFAVLYFLDKGLAQIVIDSPFHSSIARLLHSGDLTAIDPKGFLGIFVAIYWGGAMIGRFVGSALTQVMAPGAVLSVFGLGAIMLLIVSGTTEGIVSMWSLLLVGFFNSIMFPTIFTLAIDKLDDLKPQGSGVLCSAIVGGALIPPLYGWMVEWQGFELSFILFIVCYAYIAWYAYKVFRGRYERV